MSPSLRATERLLFEQLFRETRDDLLAYAMRRTASAEDAADVVSETYLIAWRKLEKGPARGQRAAVAVRRRRQRAAPSATARAKR